MDSIGNYQYCQSSQASSISNKSKDSERARRRGILLLEETRKCKKKILHCKKLFKKSKISLMLESVNNKMEGKETCQGTRHVWTGKRLAVMDKKAKAFPLGFKTQQRMQATMHACVCGSLMTPFIHKMH